MSEYRGRGRGRGRGADRGDRGGGDPGRGRGRGDMPFRPARGRGGDDGYRGRGGDRGRGDRGRGRGDRGGFRPQPQGPAIYRYVHILTCGNKSKSSKLTEILPIAVRAKTSPPPILRC